MTHKYKTNTTKKKEEKIEILRIKDHPQKDEMPFGYIKPEQGLSVER